jgi:hypothetical protein
MRNAQRPAAAAGHEHGFEDVAQGQPGQREADDELDRGEKDFYARSPSRRPKQRERHAGVALNPR